MLCKQSKYTYYKGHLELLFKYVVTGKNGRKQSQFIIRKEDDSLFLKKCNECEMWKTPKEMKSDKNLKHGVSSYCRKCSQNKKRAYKKANKAITVKEHKIYQEKHRKRLCDYKKEWRGKNQEAIKRYYTKNKEALKELSRKHRCLRKNVVFEVSGNIAVKKFYKNFGIVCGLTGKPIDKENIEHLLPVIKGGGNTWYNLYPAEKNLNLSKQGSNVFEWIKRKSDIDFTFFFTHTLPYLAQYKGLTVDEFIEWYNSTYENHIDQISSQQNNPSNTEELPLQEAFLF